MHKLLTANFRRQIDGLTGQTTINRYIQYFSNSDVRVGRISWNDVGFLVFDVIFNSFKAFRRVECSLADTGVRRQIMLRPHKQQSIFGIRYLTDFQYLLVVRNELFVKLKWANVNDAQEGIPQSENSGDLSILLLEKSLRCQSLDFIDRHAVDMDLYSLGHLDVLPVFLESSLFLFEFLDNALRALSDQLSCFL